MKTASLKIKLGLAFGALLALMMVVGGIGYDATYRLSNANENAIGNLKRSNDSTLITAAMEKQTTAVRGFLLMGHEQLLNHDKEGQTEFQNGMEKTEKMLSGDEDKRFFGEIRGMSEQFRSILDKEISWRRTGQEKRAVELEFSGETTQLRNQLRNTLKKLDGVYDKQSQEAVENGNKIESRTRTLILVCSFIGLGLGIGVAVVNSRSIVRMITRIVGAIQRIAANDLTVEDLELTTQDEIGMAGAALNQMKGNLRTMIQSIAGTAEHVASASEEISSSATQQAQAAETQKEQATQVATAMQEMSSTVVQVSENSNKAAEASRHAAETARQGGAIVEETLLKMRAIAESVGGTAKKVEELGRSSDQIGRIIGVIDGIADQTNLLALNAAIEAARAGEQGRGFAVVADEVRKLAERTTTATKEIAQMIQNIQDETKAAVSAMEQGTKQVEEGVSSTAKAGESLKEIIEMSERVGGMITHIATAATEQSSATEQVNNNMDQITRLVKESAVGAQQSAKACQDLSGLALDLQKMVSEFKVEGHEIRPRGALDRPKVFAAGAR